MIQSKFDYKNYLEKDRIALGIKRLEGFRVRIQNIFFPNEIYKFQKLLRKLEYYENVKKDGLGLMWIIAKIRFRRQSIKLGFSIPINCFGPGLSIAHYGTIIVNSNARIGANCRLHAGVNIGASAGSIEAPYLGDNIYIGPGAILFGNISIADNVIIAANATVNKSCEVEQAILAGTPAKIVKKSMLNWLEFNRIYIE